MSHNDLAGLLESLAEEVNTMPQREISAPAWAKARQIARGRAALVAAAVVVAIGASVAVLVPGGDHPVLPGGSPTAPAEPEPLRARAAHTATLLADGRVLIAGGCATDGCATADGSPTTEFYVPGQGFTPGPDLVQPRQGHAAALLPDGRVLVIGGWPREGASPLDSAEVYNPVTGQFEPVGSMTVARGGPVATALPDGRVLIVGGESGRTAELFDPGSNTFIPAAPLPQSPRIGAATTLNDGRILVVGAQYEDEGDAAPGAIYDPASDTWEPTGALGTPRSRFAVAPLPDGGVLVLGGNNGPQVLRSTEIYDPATGQFTPGPDMDTARYKFSDAVAVDAEGRIVVAGGTHLAVYDGESFHPVPGTVGPIRWVPTLTALPDGGVLLVGGYDEGIDLYDDSLLVTSGQLDAIG